MPPSPIMKPLRDRAPTIFHILGLMTKIGRKEDAQSSYSYIRDMYYTDGSLTHVANMKRSKYPFQSR